MFSIKKILTDVLVKTYSDDPKLDEYRDFEIKVLNKNLKSKHGDYDSSKRSLRIFNLYRENSAIIATALHELAHHIDYCNRGKTDHNVPFYFVYQKLLHTAIDIGVLNKEEYLQVDQDASDQRKVVSMIEDYHAPEAVPQSLKKRIQISNCVSNRKQLESKGYRYNFATETWDKEIYPKNIEAEEKFLKTHRAKYEILEANQISFHKSKRVIMAGHGSHSVRRELMKHGFYWDGKEQRWCMEVGDSELKPKMKELKTMFPGMEIYVKKDNGKW